MSVYSVIRKPLIAAVLGAFTVALPASALYFSGAASRASAAHALPEPAAATAPAPVPMVSTLPDFRALVERYGPAVVNVSVRGEVKTVAHPQMPPGFDQDNPLFRFFGMPVPPNSVVPMRGEGSGFIVSPDGVILTNAHVVDDASKVTVKLTDHREFEAHVIGSDATSDVAVLKIDGKDLPVVRLGDPTSLAVGEWVVAIGSPFGFENSVTAGIVSAKGRTLPDDTYVPFIQTDVAVNPGNSGGPLFNMRGEVVGINSQIYSRSGGYQGVSFAIPIDVAMNVSGQLQASGHVTRGRLGVQIQNVDQALAESFGLDVPKGALVADVEEDGPANAAGIKAGDVILAFDGKPVESAGQLPALVAATKPGSKVDVQIWRNHAQRDVRVKVAAVADDETTVAANDTTPGGRLGLRVRPLSPSERSASNGEDGLVVESADGAAAEAGIRPGDIVLSANGRPVHEASELRNAVAGAKKHIALLVQRGDSRLYVPVELG
jgi:serine protease Do